MKMKNHLFLSCLGMATIIMFIYSCQKKDMPDSVMNESMVFAYSNSDGSTEYIRDLDEGIEWMDDFIYSYYAEKGIDLNKYSKPSSTNKSDDPVSVYITETDTIIDSGYVEIMVQINYPQTVVDAYFNEELTGQPGMITGIRYVFNPSEVLAAPPAQSVWVLSHHSLCYMTHPDCGGCRIRRNVHSGATECRCGNTLPRISGECRSGEVTTWL